MSPRQVTRPAPRTSPQPIPPPQILAPRRLRDERGSVAIEAVVGLPAFALFIALIVMGGRVEITRRHRSGSLRRRTNSLAGTQQDRGCRSRAHERRHQPDRAALHHQQVVVDAAGFDAPLGTTVLVGVTVTCRVGLADLSLPGVPGHRISPLPRTARRRLSGAPMTHHRLPHRADVSGSDHSPASGLPSVGSSPR